MMLSGMLHGALLDAAGWAGVNQSLRDQRDEARKQRDEAEQELQGLREALASCQEHADAAWAERDAAILKLENTSEPKCEHGVSSLCCSMHRNREDWLLSHIKAIGFGDMITSDEEAGKAVAILRKWRNRIAYHSEGSLELHEFLIEVDQALRTA